MIILLAALHGPVRMLGNVHSFILLLDGEDLSHARSDDPSWKVMVW